jgi:hypothetical protein
LWKAIEKMARQPGPRQVAVAYWSSHTQFRLRPRDVAIVNASDDAIKGGQTSAAVLEAAWNAGVKQLYSNARLHAKVIITRKAVLVGSANLSQNSPSLIEAAVYSADEVIRAAVETWWRNLLQDKGTKRINLEFLKRINSLPVERRGRGPGGKPTLSDALDGELPVLKDYLYGWYEQAGTVGQRVVTREARQRGLLPARIPSRSWTWYEWEYEPGLLKSIRSDCEGKPVIDLRAVTNSKGQITRFAAIEPKTSSFVGAFRITERSHDAIIMVTLRQNAPGLRLSGPQWRRELVKRLSRGLRKRPRLGRRITERPTCLIEPSELLELYHAG